VRVLGEARDREEVGVVPVLDLPAGHAGTTGLSGLGARCFAQQRRREPGRERALPHPLGPMEQERVRDAPGREDLSEDLPGTRQAENVVEDHDTASSRQGKTSDSRSAIRASTSSAVPSAATIRKRKGSASASARYPSRTRRWKSRSSCSK